MNSLNILYNIVPPTIIKKFQIICSFLETSSFHLPHLSLNGFLNRPYLIAIIIAPTVRPTVKTTQKMKIPIFTSILIVSVLLFLIVFTYSCHLFLDFSQLTK